MPGMPITPDHIKKRIELYRLYTSQRESLPYKKGEKILPYDYQRDYNEEWESKINQNNNGKE